MDGPQPSSRLADRLVPHLPVALVCGGVLLAARFVPLEKMPIIPCVFKRIAGLPCLFCGMTRSFVAMAHGRVAEAVHESPAGVLLFCVAAGIGLTSLIRLMLPWKFPRFPAWFTGRRVAWTAAVVLLANWIYRVWSGRL